jgi:hypothetical protein
MIQIEEKAKASQQEKAGESVKLKEQTDGGASGSPGLFEIVKSYSFDQTDEFVKYSRII